jgi:hypothetical protein
MNIYRSFFTRRKAKDALRNSVRIGVDGLTAMHNALRNKARKFPDRKDPRFQDGVLLPDCMPSFTMQPGQSIFTIGSCFARNVEDVLL